MVTAPLAPYWRRNTKKHRIHYWACGWAEGPELTEYQPTRRELLLLLGWAEARLEPPKPWCRKCASRAREALPEEIPDT